MLASKWSGVDRKIKITSILKNIKNNPKLSNWVKNFNKTQSKFVYKQSLYALRLYVIKLTLEILRHSKGFLTSVPDECRFIIRHEILDKEIKN